MGPAPLVRSKEQPVEADDRVAHRPRRRREDPVAEHGTLYNFGVLTKRYELVSRTAGQLAPGVLLSLIHI